MVIDECTQFECNVTHRYFHCTGDHGGETENEVTTAMFAYSPVHAFFDDVRRTSESVSQVDIVPTLAAILGVPVPFSNTGRVVLQCLPKTILHSVASAAFILWQNIEQITKYVKEYSSRNRQFENGHENLMISTYPKLKDRWLSVQTMREFREFVDEYDSYMRNILEMCRNIWIQFDFSLISCGIILMLVAAVLNVKMVTYAKTKIVVDLNPVYYSIGILVIGWLMLPMYTALVVFELFSLLCLVFLCFQWQQSSWNVRISHVHFILSQVCLAAALFSNSFIIEELSLIHI